MKLFALATVVMTCLKLGGVIDWSWFIVALPLASAILFILLVDMLVSSLLRKAAKNGDINAMIQLALRGEDKPK